MNLLRRLFRKSRLSQYVQAVEEGTRQQQEQAIKLRVKVTKQKSEMDSFFEKNHFSALVEGLLSGSYGKRP